VGKVWYNPKNQISFNGKWWDKEIVILRKANKEHFCGECYRKIKKGEHYFEDRFSIERFEFEWESQTKSYIHRVCQKCWKGVNLITPHTRKEPDSKCQETTYEAWKEKHSDQLHEAWMRADWGRYSNFENFCQEMYKKESWQDSSI